MSSGKAPRQKGARFERAVVRLLQDRGLGAERIPLLGSAGGRYSGDLTVPCCGRDLIVEAKSRGGGFKRIYRWLIGRDALVLRADRGDTLVVLPLRLATLSSRLGRSQSMGCGPKPLTITSATAAHKALAQLRAGRANAVKVLRNGKTELIIRSESGSPAWEAKVGSGPPWQLNFVIYLLNPHDASVYTSINSTTGQRIAWERLSEKMKFMRALRGERVAPIVRLSTAQMKTKFGTKMRPEFKIVDWRELGGAPQQQQLQAPPAGKPVAALTMREILNDDIPF